MAVNIIHGKILLEVDAPTGRLITESEELDKDGKPIVMYHGTSKDVDFKKFKAGRRGIWFTSSTDEASMYAKDNDSKGYKRDGWDFKKVNERIEVFLMF